LKRVETSGRTQREIAQKLNAAHPHSLRTCTMHPSAQSLAASALLITQDGSFHRNSVELTGEE
jgi:hypothetical protein